MKKSWMSELSVHYRKTRSKYPHEDLLILFDVDGTILDMRWMILYALQDYDRTHNTYYFEELALEDINVHENQVEILLDKMDIFPDDKNRILSWFKKHCWSPRFILEAHRPFSGVLEVIRWFQLQPRTFVGLNTGRPDKLKYETIKSLNKLGINFKIRFDEELIYMNPRGWEEEVEQNKVNGIEFFRDKGYKIFAFVDNEPENLKAVSKIDFNNEILLVHADTIFESKRVKLPKNSVKGKSYDITDLIPERELPEHIQFVWHGINDFANLRQFLSSNITWGECHVRYDSRSNELLLRHDAFEEDFLKYDSDVLSLKKILACLSKTNKSIKIDLKTGGYETIDKVIELLEPFKIDQKRLWFNGNVERIQQEGFRILSRAFPKSVIQCPVDFLAPLIKSVPDKAKDIVDLFTSWGINRFSVKWDTKNMQDLFDQMDKWGHEINIYSIPNLEAFLQAVLLMPTSITSDFNFPKWYYFGKGSSEDGSYYQYQEIR